MTTATEAGGAVLQVVAWLRKNSGGDEITISDSNLRTYQPKFVQDAWGTCPTLQALTPHAPAHATIDELRAEVERLRKERDEAIRRGNWYKGQLNEACEGSRRIALELDALKAKQIDVEAVMRLADGYADAARWNLVNGEKPVHAAREALRASLLGDGGTL